MYTVRIKRSYIDHPENPLVQFDSGWDCPLARAIKKQIPEFPLIAVGQRGDVYSLERIYRPIKGVWNEDALLEFIASEEEEYEYSFE